ncbi:MAG: Recombinase [Firmicutes bacterium ADurb.Bin300]|nr:MAG: Recombinase [Firmicutes bacterium ADurb.Bin300]
MVPEEAELIRRIYSLFMSGRTSTYIAKLLTEEGIPAPRGGQKWQSSTIESILTNEKYKGCALLQKCFTVDFLTKKRKVNEGEVPQYFVENSHEAIISPEEWQAVQYEVARRKTLGKRYSGTSIFAAKIVCADCGAFYGAKVWHSNSKYKKTVWRCNAKFDGEKHCDTPTLDEEEIKARFLSVFNGLLDQKEETIENLRFVQDTLTDCTEIDKKIEELQSELEVVAELTRRCIEENSTTAIDQDTYFKKYNGYVARFERATAKLDELQAEREKRMVKADRIGAIMFRIMELGNELTEFDTTLWLTAIEKVTAHPDRMLTFHFYSGMQIDVFPQEGTRKYHSGSHPEPGIWPRSHRW